MSQSPPQQQDDAANGKDSENSTLKNINLQDVSLISSGRDEVAGTSVGRTRSARFSRAFAMAPFSTAPIVKPKPTNLNAKHLDLTKPFRPGRLSPIEADSDSPEANKIVPLPPVSLISDSPLNKGLVTGTDSGEFEYLRIKTCQRSASLKSQITPPGTPRRKKAVRFADALGLDLASVRQILDNDESSHIQEYPARSLAMRQYDSLELTEDCYLMPLFSQPACIPNFFNLVRTSRVMLENCLVHDDTHPSISGTVRVSNIGYHKQVIVHYTIDRWISSQDVQATYVPHSHDGQTDRFSFHIMLPVIFQPGSRLEMAIKYIVNGQTFWDNNHNKNYVVECYGHMDTNEPSWLHFF